MVHLGSLHRRLPERVSCWMCLMSSASKLSMAEVAAPSMPCRLMAARRMGAERVLLCCAASSTRSACAGRHAPEACSEKVSAYILGCAVSCSLDIGIRRHFSEVLKAGYAREQQAAHLEEVGGGSGRGLQLPGRDQGSGSQGNQAICDAPLSLVQFLL